MLLLSLPCRNHEMPTQNSRSQRHNEKHGRDLTEITESTVEGVNLTPRMDTCRKPQPAAALLKRSKPYDSDLNAFLSKRTSASDDDHHESFPSSTVLQTTLTPERAVNPKPLVSRGTLDRTENPVLLHSKLRDAITHEGDSKQR